MSSKRIVGGLLAALSLAAAPAAQATDYAPGSPAFEAALAAGLQHWGQEPCAGEVAYGFTDLEGDTIGYASWSRPLSAPDDPTRFSACRIDFDSATASDPALFCTAMAHELGHLLGHPHSSDPDDLMAPQLGAPLPECMTAMAPFAEPDPQPEAVPEPDPDVAAAAPPPTTRRGSAQQLRRASRSRRRRGCDRRRSSAPASRRGRASCRG